MSNRIIALLTDFGYRDPYVGVMKAVIKSINPFAEIIDLTHGITRQDYYEAAVTLMVSAKYFPRGTIFVCVVDPGVGSERRAIVIETTNYFLVGPDNGCLSLLAENDGIKRVYDVSNSLFRLREVSHTFHGRDVFAPIAAYLSLGYSPTILGREIPPNSIKKIELAPVEITDNGFKASVLYIDIFGNIMTNATKEVLEKLGWKQGDILSIEFNEKPGVLCKLVPSFSHVKKGEYACYINSWGYFEIAINMGNAARELGVKKGLSLTIRKR
ncbi:MAG: S-adenosyl-l-methionine hydroxide adenosyltransferase family protein [Thermoprotei archaeon]